MKEIALHLLDLAENSVSAGARRVQISVCEDLQADQLSATVEDNGRGMSPEMVKAVVDPFVTSRTTRKVGLGIPLLKEAAEASNGALTISSEPGVGTKVEATFQHSHIDRMPLGKLDSTILGLTVGHLDVHWVFDYTAQPADGSPAAQFIFDDEPIKEILADTPLTHPDVLAYLRETLETGIRETKQVLN
jgi:anti-sigma regulatory factor (Ser/Thr protein kinase)